MCPCVSLQIKCVIEPFATECAEIPLNVTVTLHVTVQQPLQREDLGAHSALEFGGVGVRSQRRHLFNSLNLKGICGQWVFDSITTIDQLQLSVFRDSNLKRMGEYYICCML